MQASLSDFSPLVTNWLGVKVYVPAFIFLLLWRAFTSVVQTWFFLVVGSIVCNLIYVRRRDLDAFRWLHVNDEHPPIVIPLGVLAFEPFSLFFLSTFLASITVFERAVYLVACYRAVRLCFEHGYHVIITR
jgi:hypothetical protein